MMKRLTHLSSIALLVGLILPLSGGSASADAPAGDPAIAGAYELYRAGNPQALNAFERAAADGNAEAAFMVGVMNHFGQGTTVDAKKAVAAYTQAADKNFIPAVVNLGVLYRDGAAGVERDLKKAAAYLSRGVAAGDPQAMLSLGGLHWNGQIDKADKIEAMALWQLAAEAGIEQADTNLANAGVDDDAFEKAEARAEVIRSAIKSKPSPADERIADASDRKEANDRINKVIKTPPSAPTNTDDVADHVTDPAAEQSPPEKLTDKSVEKSAPAVGPELASSDGGTSGAKADKAPVEARGDTGAAGSTAIKLKRFEIKDPGMGNMVSHTLLVPEGWKVEGGPFWLPGRKPFVQVAMSVTGPNGEEVSFVPSSTYNYSEISPNLAEWMRANNRPFPQEGSVDLKGNVYLPPPKDAAEFVTKYVLPTGRPKATELKVADIKPWPEMEKIIAEQWAPVLEQNRQSAAMARQNGMETTDKLACSIVSLRYSENGVRFREDVPMIFSHNTTTMNMNNDPFVAHFWFASIITAFRAPEQTYAASEPIGVAIANSFQPTPQWQAKVLQLQADLFKIEQEGRKVEQQEFAKRQKIIQETNEYISDLNKKTIADQDKSRDRMNHEFSNVIKGVDDFKVSATENVSLPNTYDHVYTNDKNDFYMTNDVNAQKDLGTDWRPVERVRLPE